jgi:predicted ATPase/signal transduction histidine kinase/DNA-binding response OmpR family regulator
MATVRRERDPETGRSRLVRLAERSFSNAWWAAEARNDYEIARGLELECVLRPVSMVQRPEGIALLYEDPGAVSMSARRAEQPTIREFLRIAGAAAEALEAVHRAGYVHRGITPESVLTDGARVWLTGFGDASRFSSERQQLTDPGRLGVRLPYVSPEQTGRMNRSVDHRSDLYSLGVVLYELLTGELPVTAPDPMGWVHAHMARRPTAPETRRAGVSKAISNVLLKLLAKNPEDRYQSARGLLSDLRILLEADEAGTPLLDLEPGQKDVSDTFRIPERLYGRADELAELLGGFDGAAAGQPGLMLVTGWAGIGKSRLINEVQRPTVERRGYFTFGKSDQFRRDLPYRSLIGAFQELVRQILTEPEERVAAWKAALVEALGPNGQVIIDVIPEVEIIIGPQPPPAQVGSNEARTRFQVVFQRFVQVFARPEHPLVIFLDDLQWIDRPSLAIIEQIFAVRGGLGLYLIGAYRDAEVDEDHPLVGTVANVEGSGAPVGRIHLEPLRSADLAALISDTLGARGDAVAELTAIVQEKTAANPFFVRRFLKTLHEDGLITFDHDAGRWRWDPSAVSAAGITDNVVELMAGRIERLQAHTRAALEVASVVGSTFELDVVAMAHGRTRLETAADLWPAMEDDLIAPIGDGYKLLEEETEGPIDVRFRFVHDRIQEAAYSRLPEAGRAPLHLHIARRLRENTPEAQLEDAVFDLVHHLGRSTDLIEDADERLQTARLFLLAGRRAAASSAHEPALRYLRSGSALLGDAGWEADHDLTFGLHLALAEAELVTTHSEAAEALCESLLARARSPLEQTPVYGLRMHLLFSQMRLSDAVDQCLELVALLGHPIEPLAPEAMPAAFGELAQLIGERTPDQLVDLPLATKPEVLAVLRMAELLPLFAQERPELLPAATLMFLKLTVREGMTPSACYAFGTYGVILAAMQQYDAAYAFGRAGLAVIERFPTAGVTGTLIEFPVFQQHWKEPVEAVVAQLHDGARRALDLGDPTVFGYCRNQEYLHRYIAGESLESLEADWDAVIAEMVDYNQAAAKTTIDTIGQFLLCLRGESENPARIDGDRANYDRSLAGFFEWGLVTAVVYMKLAEAHAAYLMGDLARTLEVATSHPEAVDAPANLASMSRAVLVWFRALARVGLAIEAGGPMGEVDAEAFAADRGQMAVWAESCEANYGHRLALLDAEAGRLEGAADTLDRYEQAIRLARKHGYMQDAALAYERAGEFHRAADRPDIARAYAQEAVRLYGEWGAWAKVAQLGTRWSEALGDVQATGGDARGGALDIDTVLKATEALSEEILLDRLLDRMLRLLIENAGAERGVLALSRDGLLRVQAAGRSTDEQVEVMQDEPIEARSDLPIEVLHFVERTRETVILADAVSSGRFNTSVYFRKATPRSVLCLPLLKQGELTGVLYFENNLATDAFTEERAELLRVLSSQAATAIENALLYDELKTYSDELKEKNEALLELDKLRDEFLAKTSHELRTPIHGIIGIAQSVLEGEVLEDPLRHNLTLIAQSGRRLSNLVNDILDFSTLRQREIGLSVAPMHVGDVVEGVMSLSAGLVGKKDLSLATDLQADLPVVDGDRDRVEQILLNLVGNAVKFTESGHVKVAARRHREGDFVEVSIEDTGVGIAQEHLASIFEAFGQGGTETSAKYGGTGLGLAVTRQLVEAQGGALTVESTLGVGSLFRFTLPVSEHQDLPRAAPVEAQAGRALEAPALQEVDTAEGMDLPVDRNGAVVLAVDDEPVNLQVIVNQLVRQGFEVVTASGGTEALRRIDEGLNPDIVLLDVMMPDLDGYQTCLQLRQKFTSNRLPVVMLTAKDRVTDLVEGLKSGANDYVTKPFSSAELNARMQTHLRLASVNRAVGQFVPGDFLSLLGRDSIVDVRLGDSIAREMSVMHADMRTLAGAALGPEESFRFLNEYLGMMEPVILEHDGFVDKYVGDAIVALFDREPAAAVRAGLGMLRTVGRFNQERAAAGLLPVQLGAGINTGPMMLGTVGTEHRMDTTVVSDAVEVAGRLDALNPRYNSGLLISEPARAGLPEDHGFSMRLLDKVQFDPNTPPLPIYEVYDADAPAAKAAKDATRGMFEQAVTAFHERDFPGAQRLFTVIQSMDPTDVVTRQYLERCQKIQQQFTGMSF